MAVIVRKKTVMSHYFYHRCQLQFNRSDIAIHQVLVVQ